MSDMLDELLDGVHPHLAAPTTWFARCSRRRPELLRRLLRSTGFLPVNHAVMVRKRVVKENPLVPEALFEAFEASRKHAAYRRDPAPCSSSPMATPSSSASSTAPTRSRAAFSATAPCSTSVLANPSQRSSPPVRSTWTACSTSPCAAPETGLCQAVGLRRER